MGVRGRGGQGTGSMEAFAREKSLRTTRDKMHDFRTLALPNIYTVVSWPLKCFLKLTPWSQLQNL